MPDSSTILSNNKLTVTVADHGAELRSIVEATSGVELLWQGDPAFWGRTAPILFPIVGRLVGDTYLLGGASHRLPQHGFGRDSQFAVVDRDDAMVVLELEASDVTRAVYPFEFTLRVTHRLRERVVETTCDVLNEGDGELLFSIGAHPAFNVPLGGRGRPGEWYVELELEESGECRRPTAEGLQSDPRPGPLREGRYLDLHPGVFDGGAYIFAGVRSPRAHLRCRSGGPSVIVDLGGAPYLGIWSKPGAPFVCIEPWFGVADPPGEPRELALKEGIISLGPGERFESHVSIEIA